MRLNQIIAIVTGTKAQAQKAVTSIYTKIQKADLMSGINRQYKPKDEDGENLPPESKGVRLSTSKAIKEVAEIWSETWDVVATQDYANTKAFADVIVDGDVILREVNVLHLLYLDKQLIDVKAFVEKLPPLDPSEEWEYSKEMDLFMTKPYETTRSKKIPRNHVRAEATKEHPAQVDIFHEDKIVGTWSTIKYSGAMSPKIKKETLLRIKDLQDAVKKAREEANMINVEIMEESESILSYIFE